MVQEENRPVVVGVDFGPGGDHAILEGVRRVAEGWATALHAVHVFEPSAVSGRAHGLFSDEKFLEFGPRAIRQRVEEIVRSDAATLPLDALVVHARLGTPADILLQVAADCGAALIVVGALPRERLDRLLGPVSELLVRTGTCPVLVASSKDHCMLLRKTDRPAQPKRSGAASEDSPAHDDLSQDS